jgi:tetratricopeptide (TPR) repeat protein
VLRPTLDLPHQLPPDVAGFTGREAELSKLRALVAEGASGTVVISAIAGTAGVGKTALAVHLAHQLAPDFPDAQLYVNLHGYEHGQRLNPAQVLDRFLRALGVPPDVLPKQLDEQAARYRGLLAGRRILVVLDNASSAEQVRPLLPASASCLVLVTSRDRLAGLVAAEGAKVLMLDVLAPSEALDLMSRTAGSERVSAEPEAAGEVVRLCACLPLAVRIAGARLATRPGMSLADLAKRLSDERARLEELSAGDVGVRASFALSYQALHPEAARMFRRLGLIPGPGFSLGVSAALIDGTWEEAETLLEGLVDAHLIEATSVSGRYRFHDLLRLYAREQLESDETDQDQDRALRRILEWYLDTTDAAQQFLTPGRRRLTHRPTGRWTHGPTIAGLGDALAWLEEERASLVAATHQATERGLHSIAWQLSDALGTFLALRSYYADGQNTNEVGLAAARKARNRQAEAWIMCNLGHSYRDLGKCNEAVELHQRSLATFRSLEDAECVARVLTALGRDYVALGRSEEAIVCLQQALATSRRMGYAYREGVTLEYLGVAYRAVRQPEQAIDCFERSLEICRQLGGRWSEGSTLRNLGQVYGDLCRFEEAIDCYKESLVISREVGRRWGEGRALELLGLALQHTEGVEAARACWDEALAIFTELGAPQADEVRARLEESHEALESNT